MRKRLDPATRLKLVNECVNINVWRPTAIRQHIQKKTGYNPAPKTIRQDIRTIRISNREFYHDIALGGATHILAKTIRELTEEIQQMKEDIKALDLADHKPNTQANLARTRAYIHEKMVAKRLQLFEILETYPIWETLQEKVEHADYTNTNPDVSFYGK